MAHTNRVIRKGLIKQLFRKMQVGLRKTSWGCKACWGEYNGKPHHIGLGGKRGLGYQNQLAASGRGLPDRSCGLCWRDPAGPS